ncbi:MAG TPA: AIPR family protein [Candidatus Binataceae bacterium]|nr:AIPR family protein [Candidatus Binataceae bacterium]
MSILHIGHIKAALNVRFESLIDLSDLGPNCPSDERENFFLTRSLAAFAIAELAGVDDKIAAASVVDGSKDNGIDGFYFDNSEHVCYLVQSKWSKSGTNSIQVGEVHKFIQGVRDLLSASMDRFDKLQKKQQDIDNALGDSTAKFVLVVAYTGEPALAPEAQSPLDDLLKQLNDVSDLINYKVLRQADLHAIVAEAAQGESIDLNIMLHEWGTLEEPYRAYYGQVLLEDIIKWKKYGQKLYSGNLRGFKGSTEVNDAIISTMRQSPQHFWFFNNGITVLCRKISKQPLGGSNRTSGVFDCEGASVVNGAQTVGSIIAASSSGENGFHHARVLVRLISLEGCPPNFDSQLTRAANTQNRIEKKDFAALDPEQERLHTELFLEFSKDYSYKTGDYEPQPDEGCTLDEAAVALACRQPDATLVVFAKAAQGRLYDDVTKPPYTALFNPSVSAYKLWRSVEVMRLVDITLKACQKSLTGKDRYIAVHGNRFILYIVFQSLAALDSPKCDFENLKAGIPAQTQAILQRTITASNKLFPETYAGNLFKNASKLKDLAGEVTIETSATV